MEIDAELIQAAFDKVNREVKRREESIDKFFVASLRSLGNQMKNRPMYKDWTRLLEVSTRAAKTLNKMDLNKTAWDTEDLKAVRYVLVKALHRLRYTDQDISDDATL